MTNRRKKFKYWWQFLVIMTKKEIKAKYKMTLFGFVWAFLNPLIQIVVLCYIFSFFILPKVDNYFIFIFSGLILWNFVSSTILRSTTAIIDQRYLIQKSSFPKEILILSIVAANFFHLLISLGLLMIIVVLMGGFHWQWILLPFILIILLLMTSGFSLLLSALNVKRRDINIMTQTAVSIWFYLTPIVYTLDLIPAQQVGWFCLNPMTGIIDITRFFLFQIPIKYLFLDLISLSLSLVILIVGLIVFRKLSKFFNEWV